MKKTDNLGHTPAQPPQTNGYPSYHQQSSSYSTDVTDNSLEEYSDVIEKISGLVDRYWNGSKSLIGNLKFRGN